MASDRFPLGTLSVHTTPELHQADCERCGWHTRQAEGQHGKAWVEQMARLHFPICPNPSYRSGAVMECGCWYYAGPGESVGFTKAECPLHGLTMMAKANVEESVAYGTGLWRPAGAGGSDD